MTAEDDLTDVPDLDFDRVRVLAECRATFGARTTSAWHADRAWLEYPRPFWLRRDDELTRNFDEQERLFTHGKLELGAFVVANEVLCRDADADAPCCVVHSPDVWFETHPEELFALANRLRELRSNGTPDPELAAFAARLADDLARDRHSPVPAQLADGRAAFVSTVFVVRDHLPRRWLARSLVPIVTARPSTEIAGVLPSGWWPQDLFDEWD